MVAKTNNNKAVLTLGTFDGVHMGHRALMRETVELATRASARAVAYTFSNHPRSIFGTAPAMLTTSEEKAAIISRLGLEPVLVPFTPELAAQTPQQFFDSLMSEFDIEGIVAGYDYRFGHHAKGDHEVLRRLGESHGITVRIHAPVRYGDEEVSSTRIRTALRFGLIEEANAMLVDPYAFFGVVTPNSHIGGRIGFPTANIEAGEKVTPRYGVYASELIYGSERYPSVTNIGLRPTVGINERVLIETHMLDNSLDLYGQTIEIRLLSFIRAERRFGSFGTLAAQIEMDCAAAKAVHERISSVYNDDAIC